MSRFCGKCDFADWIMDRSDEEIKNSEFYIWSDDRRHRLDIHNQYDAALYYPYLVSMGYHSDGKDVVVLQEESFIDREEQERIGWYVRDVMKVWRRCKRKKQEFVPEDVFREVNWGSQHNPQIEEVIKRVAENGDKATFEGIHTDIHEFYRKEWYKYLLEIGYPEYKAYEWVFKGFLTREDEKKKRLEGKI